VAAIRGMATEAKIPITTIVNTNSIMVNAFFDFILLIL
jgi:hypothetical protein